MSRTLVVVLAVVLGVGGLAWLQRDRIDNLLAGSGSTPPPGAAASANQSTAPEPPTGAGVASAAVPLAVSTEPDSLRFAAGSAQLAMIQTQAIPATPLPLTDTLSARLAYDEDLTARIGVGIAGRIVAVRAAPGDVVKVGQVLAEIDSPDFGTAYADLEKARADEARKRQTLDRALELGAGEGIAAREVEAAQSDYAQAKAETARAELRMKTLNPYGLPVRGQRVWLSSPVGGVVTERTATPALEVVPGMQTPLFVVTDPRRLWLLIDLPEKLLGQIKVGGAVSVESDAYPDLQFGARIVQLGQTVDPNTRRVVVRAKVDNPERKLLPEMFVRASILQGVGTGVRVPNAALINRGLYVFVFVQTAPGEFTRRAVSLKSQGSDFSYVAAGLAGGERVVVGGALLLDAELSARAGNKS